MNTDRSLIDFGALLVEKYFKAHEKQDEVDINEYLNITEQLTTSSTFNSCLKHINSPLIC